jgi:hypothetical protein
MADGVYSMFVITLNNLMELCKIPAVILYFDDVHGTWAGEEKTRHWIRIGYFACTGQMFVRYFEQNRCQSDDFCTDICVKDRNGRTFLHSPLL